MRFEISDGMYKVMVKLCAFLVAFNLILGGYFAAEYHAPERIISAFNGGNFSKGNYQQKGAVASYDMAKDSAYWKNKAFGYSPSMNLSTANEFLDVARGYCYSYLTNSDACHSIDFEVMPHKPSNALAVTYTLFGDGNALNSIPAIKFDADLLKEERAKQDWVIYHELSHAEIALVSRNHDGQRRMDKRTDMAFDSPEPGEVLADCMTIKKAHQNYSANDLPYYISRVRNISTMNIDVMCDSWSGVLYNNLEGTQVN